MCNRHRTIEYYDTEDIRKCIELINVAIWNAQDNTFYAQLGTNAGLTNNIYVGLAWNSKFLLNF